jgi:hypothetical protein
MSDKSFEFLFCSGEKLYSVLISVDLAVGKKFFKIWKIFSSFEAWTDIWKHTRTFLNLEAEIFKI